MYTHLEHLGQELGQVLVQFRYWYNLGTGLLVQFRYWYNLGTGTFLRTGLLDVYVYVLE